MIDWSEEFDKQMKFAQERIDQSSYMSSGTHEMQHLSEILE